MNPTLMRQFLSSGWVNVPIAELILAMSGWKNNQDLSINQLINSGEAVTVIFSDAAFTVPDPLPGGVALVGSKQHGFDSDVLIELRAWGMHSAPDDTITVTRLWIGGVIATVILSAAAFTVPSSVGNATILASAQHEFTNSVLAKVRIITRG